MQNIRNARHKRNLAVPRLNFRPFAILPFHFGRRRRIARWLD